MASNSTPGPATPFEKQARKTSPREAQHRADTLQLAPRPTYVASTAMYAVIPLKGFNIAKERLATVLDRTRRSSLVRAAADRVALACAAGGFDLVVVTGDESVAAWASDRSARVIADPSQGLDAACQAGIAAGHEPWIIVHVDLPLLDATTMNSTLTALGAGRSVIAPSRDGGTNLLGSSGGFRFSYGPASFHRHLAALTGPFEVITKIETIVELDTPSDLEAAATLPGGAWLAPFLS